MLTFEERVYFYLGEKFSKSKNININNFKDIKTINDLTENVNILDIEYDCQLKNLLIKTNHTNKKFFFKRLDIIEKEHFLTLCKNRCDGNNDSVLLRCFNFGRHWGYYYNKPKDIPFDKKISKIFWRGNTTGCLNLSHASSDAFRPVNRFTMMKQWYNKHRDIDIGFSYIWIEWLKKEYSQYVKGECTIEDFLKYKYILSIEGTDKDSGLNWKLNSNSLVLMPKPRVTSWLMETTLIPNYHYVLLKDDFSDLKEKLDWCNSHQKECKNIIKNANNFMSQFADNNKEEKLEEEVINRYFKIVS